MITLEAIQNVVLHTKPLLLNAQELHIEEKAGHANYVTDMDAKVQALLKKELAELLPEAAFIGEEQSNQPLGDDWTWIVDPIDGTTNFIKNAAPPRFPLGCTKTRSPLLPAFISPTRTSFLPRKRVRARI